MLYIDASETSVACVQSMACACVQEKELAKELDMKNQPVETQVVDRLLRAEPAEIERLQGKGASEEAAST
jgi:hypothetical protein